MEILDQIPYLETILTFLLAAHALALAVVNFTPTPIDNQAVSFAYRIIEFVAGIVVAKKVKEPNPVDGPPSVPFNTP